MSELDPAVELELASWRITDLPPLWEDVTARAAAKRPARRLRRRRRLYLAVATAAAVGLAAPAVAFVAGRLFVGHTVPGTLSAARLSLDSGRASVSLRSRGAGLVRDKSGFHYLDERGGRYAFIWHLDLEVVDRAGPATIVVDDGPRIGLCAPCRDGSGGTFRLRSEAALALLDGRATVTVGAHRARLGPAMGGRLFPTSTSRHQLGTNS